MDKFIEKINKLSLPAVILILGIMLIIVGAGLFYWRQVKLSKIYSDCNSNALEYVHKLYKEGQYVTNDTYELIYKLCLRKKGIDK